MSTPELDGSAWGGLARLLTTLVQLRPEELHIVLLGDALFVMLAWAWLERWGKRSLRHARWSRWLRFDLLAAFALLCAALWWLRR